MIIQLISIVIGIIIGAYLGHPMAYASYNDSTTSLIMIVIMILVGGVSGWLIGYLISSIIGAFLPQEHEQSEYEIGSLRIQSHVSNTVVSSGKSVTVIPRYYTTYEYTYRWEGEYKESSVLTSNATIVQRDQTNVLLIVTSWKFRCSWWNYLATASDPGYTFYVPFALQI